MLDVVEPSDTTAVMQRRARSFDAWAADYERYRPGYPDGVFDRIAERLAFDATPRVADLGAGTGKAAVAMARRGWSVTAIEPGLAMLEALRSRARGEGLVIDARLGRAEATGLPDASVDLVTAAQAFHWFERESAVDEMARIVRPGGGVAVFWNSRADERSNLLAGYTELVARYVPEEHVDRRVPRRRSKTPEELARGGWFQVDERVEVPHEVVLTHAEFVGMAFTASYIRLLLDGPTQDRFRGEVAELLARLAPAGRVVVPYDTDLYVGRRVRA
jgi:SAM-dependent methyltransferase